MTLALPFEVYKKILIFPNLSFTFGIFPIFAPVLFHVPVRGMDEKGIR